MFISMSMELLLNEKLKKIYPFNSHWAVMKSGHRMHYVDEGSGDAIVMVHGNPTWSFFYRNLVLGLRREYRCIVPDHIGCGFSDKPQDYPYLLERHIDNLVDLVKGLGLEKFHLVVHDWGGPIGLGMAEAFPERVKKITILNTAAFVGGSVPSRIRFCKKGIVGDILVRGLNAFARAATFMAVEKRLDSLVKKGYLLPYNNWKNRIALHRFVRDIPLDSGHSSWERLKQVERGLSLLSDKEVMICWGARDFCFNDAYLKEWLKRFLNARLHRYGHAGHYVLEDAGDEVLEALRDFLKG